MSSSESSKSPKTSASSDSGSSDGDELIDFAGEVLNDRYIVLKEIGHGAFSTVFVAYDFNTKSYRAVKIQNVGDYDAGIKEIEFMQKIDAQKSQYLNKLDDSFEHESDHGTHVCMVTELYAGCLYDLIRDGKYKKGMPIPFVKKVMKQILTGLDVLHKKGGILHTDIKPENILISGTNKKLEPFLNKVTEIGIESIYKNLLDEISTKNKKIIKKEVKCDLLKKTAKILIEKLDEFFGGSENGSRDESDESEDDEKKKKEQKKDEKKEVKKDEKKEDEFCILDDASIQNPQVRITDFGNCCYLNSRTNSEIQTRYYRAPEIILKHPYDEKCDIWSMACLVFELLTGDILFDPEKDRMISRDKHHLYWIQQLLGKFPEEFLKSCKNKKMFFTQNNTLKGIKKLSYIPLQSLLMTSYNMTLDSATELVDFISPMLQYFPNKRASAKTCLTLKWLTG